MAYTFELEQDFDPTPFLDGSGSATIEFALGYHIETNKIIVMSVMLVAGDSYLEGKIAGIYDLQFGIRERDAISNGVTPPDFGTDFASRYIPREFRHDVVRVLMAAVQALINSMQPRYLTMETYYGHLPDKALEKYALLCRHLEQAGYRILDQFQHQDSGINYWYFTKADIETEEPNR